MFLKKRLAQRYIISSIAPYFFLALALLTVTLIAQQTTKFAEVLGMARAPLSLAGEIFLYLLPNILIFTLPMATLVGTVTGMSRMGSDSELVALRAAGFGTTSILTPALISGALLSVLTLYMGFEVAPAAARDLREVAIRAALRRLESPVEPRSFYTDLPGKVVFVRDGDVESGQWGKVFIYWKEGDGQVRLVTARSGRIDSSGEQAELALNDAVVTTLPHEDPNRGAGNFGVMSERSSHLRMRDDRLDAQRKELLGRLRSSETEADEMGFGELTARMRSHRSPEARLEAALALHKRVALGFAAMAFSLLGAALGLRTRRGGRGMGMLLSLAAMISYYLVLLWGEHLARTGRLSPPYGAWLANVLTIAAGLYFLGEGGRFGPRWGEAFRTGERIAVTSGSRRYIFGGLLDRTLIRSVGVNFAGAFVTLVSVFLIFTLFELLRFIAAHGAGATLILRYLLFLLPLVGVAMAPMSVLVAVLVTYALISRRSEAVAWWASGQSTYRLAAPALVFSMAVGAGLWLTQERIMPKANRYQNALRLQIRGGQPRAETDVGRQWLASTDDKRIYSYEFVVGATALNAPSVFEFDEEGVHLKRVIVGAGAGWAQDGALSIDRAVVVSAAGSGDWIVERKAYTLSSDPVEVFKPMINKPAEMNSGELSKHLKQLRARGDSSYAPLAVALERKRSDPFSPLVMALVGIPLAFAFGRRSSIAALCAAIGVGLLYWAATGGFQQLGNMGVLPPVIAAWAPTVICASIGLYLLSRSKT